MPVKHIFESAVSDGGDSTLIRPSDWNADHLIVPFLVYAIGNNEPNQWAVPGTATELFGETFHRSAADFTRLGDIRLIVHVNTAGSTNAKLRAQAWDGSAWVNLATVGVGSTGMRDTGWQAVPAAIIAAGLTDVRFQGVDGNGSTVCHFANLCLWGR